MFLKIISILSVLVSGVALYSVFKLLGKQERKSNIDMMFYTILLIVALVLLFLGSIVFMLNMIK